jgi:hypothetical protein
MTGQGNDLMTINDAKGIMTAQHDDFIAMPFALCAMRRNLAHHLPIMTMR